MPAPPSTSTSGSRVFTLVEMLMAMLVMTVGLLGLLQAVQSAYRQVVTDRVREEAVILAEERMHDWRRLSFDSITGVASESVDRVIGGVRRSFDVSREKKQTGSASGPNPTVRMTVTVSWKLRGDTLSHSIYTLKTR